jgi:hydroxymethylpyrimidine pyrophosphatase-like HAD family hydrolase
VFADGGLLVYGGQSQCMPVELLLDINEESAKITAHSYEGQVYKYSMLVYDKEERINILSRLKEKTYQVFYKPPLITVIHKEVDKRKGVLHICKALAFPLDQVLVVGNSLKDWEMMSVVSHSCAVMNAEPLLKERARYTLNPDRLAAFFRFRE